MKKIKLERDNYKHKLNDYKGVISPSISARSGSGYEPVSSSVPPSASEHTNTSLSVSRGYEAVPSRALENGSQSTSRNRGYDAVSPSVIESGNASRAELCGAEGKIPVFAR